MGSKKISGVSLAASVIALVMSIIALVNCVPTQGLRFDYLGVVVGILALLVTALIGAQVGQYVFVDRKIEKITRKLARVISRKVAQEEAMEVAESIAQETASESVKKMQEDLRSIAIASNSIVEAKIAYTLCNDTKYIYKIMTTVEQYLQISDKDMSNKFIDELLTEHIAKIEQMRADGELKIREEHLPAIKEFLAKCDFPHRDKIRELLRDVKTITEQEESHEVSYFRN